MDPRIARLRTVEECATFAKNAAARGFPDLADQARKRGIQIRGEFHGATSPLEIECLQAIHAYEEVLSSQKGRRQHASRTWQMIKRHGIIPAVERVVTRRGVSSGFTSLADMGLEEYAFEAVILRHPESFSPQAVEISRKRLEEQ